MAHCVFRSDLLSGTYNGADLISAKVFDEEGNPIPVDNGLIIELEGLLEGEREIYKAKLANEDSKFEDCAIVGTPEVMYDERLKNLSDFVNEAGKPVRGYIPRERNRYSITKEGFGDVVPNTVNGSIGIGEDGKLDPTGEGWGYLLAIENTGRYTYYVISLKKDSGTTPSVKELESIAVTTPPSKVTYNDGESLNLDGLVVTATYEDSSTAVVTGFTTTPAAGATLTEANTSVTISYTEGGITKTTTQAITVS